MNLFIQAHIEKMLFLVLPFLICVNLLLVLEKIAPKLGLMDVPDARKRHAGAIPLVGGPAMFLAIALSSVLFKLQISTMLFLALALVVLGILDDRFSLPVKLRLPIQILVASTMVYIGGMEINALGNLIGLGEVNLNGAFAAIFTIVCIIGVINASNMIDGVDGLAGSILLITFLGMGISLSGSHVDTPGAAALAVVSGTLIAFLCFNARLFFEKAKVFMGDSGSMMMGLILAWFFILLTQGDNSAISPVAAGWFFGLPLLDTVAVMVQRMRNGNSPFSPGRDHLHHLLLNRGFTVNQTVARMALVHGTLVSLGIMFNKNGAAEPVLFISFVSLVIIRYLFIDQILNIIGGSRTQK